MKKKKFLTTSVTVVFLLTGVYHQLLAQNWEQVDALPANQFTALYTDDDALLIAAAANRLYYTLDGGSTWDSTAVVSPSLSFIEAVTVVGEQWYVGTTEEGIFRSNNQGQTWQTDNTGLVGLGAQSIIDLTVRGDSLFVASGGAGVFTRKISTNSAWSPYNQGLPWDVVESISNVEGTLFAGAGGNATVSMRNSQQQAWQETAFDVFDGSLNFFLGVTKIENSLLAAGTGGLYRSTDHGESWEKFHTGTGLSTLASFVQDDGVVIVNLTNPIGSSSMFITEDEGLNWQPFQPAIPVMFGFDLAILQGQLYAARSNGLWRIERTTPTKEIQNELVSLTNCFPNPFTNKATLPVLLSQQIWIDVTIFDNYGRKVRTLWQGERPAGRYEFELPGEGLPTGIYHCRVATAHSNWSQKLVKLD